MANDPSPSASLAHAADRLHAVENAVEDVVGQALQATERSLARRFGAGCVQTLRWTLRLLAWTLVAGYFAFGALLLATRYWLMPRIDEARPWLERQAAAVLRTEVRIGRIEAGWQGVHPRLRLADVRLLAGGEERLALPQVEAVVGWGSVARLSLQLKQLSVLAPQVEVRRLGPTRFEIAGFVVEPRPAQGDGGGALDWVLDQQRIDLRDARVVYVDASGPVPDGPHTFTDVSLRYESGLLKQRFALQARPPAALAGMLDLRGDFHHGWLQRPSDFSQWRGRLFAQFDFADLARLEQLARLLPAPLAIERAQGALRLWLALDHGRVEATTADIALSDVRSVLGAGLAPLEVAALRGRFVQREWGNLFVGGQEIALLGLALSGPDLALPATDLRYRYTRPDDDPAGAPLARRTQKSELEASLLSLDTLATLAGRVPLARELQQGIARHAVRGTLTGLKLSVEGPLAAPAAFSLRTRFAGLAAQAQPAEPPLTPGGRPRPGLPGFENLAGSVEANETGGTATIDAHAATLEFPGIFETPVEADRLTAQLRWQIPPTPPGSPGRIEAQIDSLSVANADLEVSASGSWRRAGEGPGSVDLSGRLLRAEVAAAPRYVPLIAGAGTRDWLARALVGGRGAEGAFRLRGELREFPYRDPKSGEFRAALRVRDGVLDYMPPWIDEDGVAHQGWPRIERIDADVVFERQKMEIGARNAQVYGARIAPATARIADLNGADVRLLVKGTAAGPAADLLRYVADSPLRERLALLAGARASGSARLELALDLPLSHAADSAVAGSVELQNTDIALMDDVPPFARASGRVEFTEKSLKLAGVTAGFVGGQARFDGGTRPDGAISIAATGTATPAGARRAVDVGVVQRLLARASGSTRYAGSFTWQAGRSELRIDSDLAGWALDAPAPFQKAAADPLPLRIEIVPAPAAAGAPERDALRVTAGNLLAVRFDRVRDAGGERRVERGVVAVGEPAAAPPAQGVLAHLNVTRLDADQWLPLLDTDVPGAVAATRGGAAAVASAMPEFVNLRARELLVAGKPITNVVAGATRAREGSETVWHANLVSDHASGALTWRPAASGGSGRVSARLTRLTIPESQRSQVAQMLEAPAADIPGFDVVADSFELAGRNLGKLELVANNVATAAGPAWVMQKLELTSPEARMSATGQWQRAAGAGDGQRTMALDLQIDFSNGGALLGRLGIPDALRGGQGRLDGALAWRGSPFSIHYPTLAGSLKIATSKGQFLKADAGAGRLLGVLSLQTLPRRITLDFRDVFSDGFAFDSIGGSAEVKAGVLTTRDFRMRGPNANVLIEGSTDLKDETQNLHVLVLPEVNAGSASLVYALMANPAIGLGTFLAQLLLRDPLSKAFSFEYDVTGSWTDPQVRRRERAAPISTEAGGN